MHIGLFDSGVGGLTVLRELRRQIPPSARYSYLGDTARLPYGDKPLKTLKQYCSENIKFLESLKVDVILIACHSLSGFFLELTQTKSGTPVYNMITPCGQDSLKRSKNKRIGVIATRTTVRTEIYPRFFKTLDSHVQIFTKACPLLVPMIEKDRTEDPAVERILKNYLDPLIAEDIDTLLLGCSHYFLLQKSLSRVLSPSIQWIHPAVQVARFIKNRVENKWGTGDRTLSSMKNQGDKWNGDQNRKERLTVYLTGHSPHFNEYCRRLLPDLIPDRIVYTFP